MADETPPTKFVTYPRGEQLLGYGFVYGSLERLEALVDGYFGLSQTFLLCFLLLIVGMVAWSFGFDIVLAVCIAVPVLAFLVTLRPIKSIVKGKGWPEWSAAFIAFATVSTGLVFGFICMQHVAISEMRRYGLRYSFLGVKNKDIVALLERAKCAQGVSMVSSETVHDYPLES